MNGTTVVRYRAHAQSEQQAFDQSLRMVDAVFSIATSKRIRKVRGLTAWDVDWEVYGRHDGRPVQSTFVFEVVKG